MNFMKCEFWVIFGICKTHLPYEVRHSKIHAVYGKTVRHNVRHIKRCASVRHKSEAQKQIQVLYRTKITVGNCGVE